MERKKIICRNCHRELEVGDDDVFHVEQGVIGTRKNFVPLDEEAVYCCEKCLRDYYDLADLPSFRSRIP